MSHRKKAALIFGVLSLGWIAVLFYFSGQDGVDSSELSLRVARRLVQWFPWIGMSAETFNPILRKLAHVGIFAIEGFLMGLCLMNAMRARRGAGLTLLLCAIMAAANEYHQTFSMGRTCQVRDVLIDSGGALLGIAAAAILLALVRLTGRYRLASTRTNE